MRRALLVGIDHYESAPLSGCIDDARAMERLLRRHDDGRVNFDTQLLTSDREAVSRARLRESVDAYVDQALGAWDQRPLFKSHVSRMLSLRNATPAIDVAILRRLPEWFP